MGGGTDPLGAATAVAEGAAAAVGVAGAGLAIACGAGAATLEPGLAERLQQRLAESAQRQELVGEPAVLLVTPPLRQTLARFVRAGVPGMHVLAWNEIPDNRRVRLVTAVGR